MKKSILFSNAGRPLGLWLALCFLLVCPLAVQAGIQHLLPKPRQILNQTGESVALQQISLTTPYFESAYTAWLTESCGAQVQSGAATSITVRMVDAVAGADRVEEAYSIDITQGKIEIEAAGEKAVFWALQTLIQLSEGETKGSVNLPVCRIVDWPAFRVRGFMHDIGRSYMEFDELKKHVALLARYKINVFHWHLTEYQGWRLESKVFPQLNASSNYTRHPGKYYSIAQVRELVEWARQHGVTVIPEIDMPGHSDAFTRAFGYKMQTTEGLATLKVLMTEICDVFSGTEWMHIGTDEVQITMAEFVPEMVAHIRAQGKKVVSWNPGYNYKTGEVDMVQMWSSRGAPLAGTPTIDSRYHYINHFDQFADIVGIYNSNIAGQTKGSHEYAGVIMGIWNDRVVSTDRDIVIQNAFYQSMLAIAERAWIGGGTYIPTKGCLLDAPHTPEYQQFADWERRFLYHRYHHLKDEPIAYVKQTNLSWRITDAFPNNGNLATVFPPENQLAESYSYGGKTYGTRKAYGAAVYLRHVWGTIIPSFFSAPAANSTAYAYTYIYSPVAQTAGAFVEFQNYGRSESDIAPPQGKWDYKGSRIWFNDVEIPAPVWTATHTTRDNEIPLGNENFSVRPPVQLQLKQGWNKVLMKLPVGAFSISQVRLQKWMFTFVLVTPDGRQALDNVVYSPEMNMNPSSDVLTSAIDDTQAFVNSTQTGTQPGEYPAEAVTPINALLDAARSFRTQSEVVAEYDSVIVVLSEGLKSYRAAINMPLASTANENIWYTLHTPLRENRYLTFKGNNVNLKGEAKINGSASQQWKFVKLSDGSLAMVNRQSESSVSPAGAYNSALKAVSGILSSGGWSFIPTYTGLTFAVSSGAVQLNQTNSGLGYAVYNWGGGSNLTDTGCRYQITEAERTPTSVAKQTVSTNHFRIVDRKLLLLNDVEDVKLFSADGRLHSHSVALMPGLYLLLLNGVRYKVLVI